MKKCPNCGGDLALALVNGQHCLVCPQCMNTAQSKNIELTKCNICGTWYFEHIEVKCPCRKIEKKEKIDE